MKFPIDFRQQMVRILGSEYEKFELSQLQTPPVSIRMNPKKTSNKIIDFEKIAWCDTGYYLKERPSFTLDPSFHGGKYYVQEAASMSIEQIINPLIRNFENKSITVLDLCAAPGGKSTHLLSLLPNDSLLVSNELIPKRNAILRENIMKWGYSNVIITSADAKQIANSGLQFDIILVDAPCSGEGMFRKDPSAILEWEKDSPIRCSTRQKNILTDIFPALKTNGYLIYSTCTYNYTENMEVVKHFGKYANLISLPIEKLKDNGVTEIKDNEFIGYSFFPHRVKSEGFFISLLQKTNVTEIAYTKQFGKKKFKNASSPPIQILNNQEQFSWHEMEDLLLAFPKKWVKHLEILAASVPVKYFGVECGQFKGHDFIPSAPLAWSIDYNNCFTTIQLSKDQAIDYLKMNDLKIESEYRGIVCFIYENINLGFGKILEGRINNYFPKNYRILRG